MTIITFALLCTMGHAQQVTVRVVDKTPHVAHISPLECNDAYERLDALQTPRERLDRESFDGICDHPATPTTAQDCATLGYGDDFVYETDCQ